MSASITTFRNVRARLGRSANGPGIAGWVTHLAREEARIRLWGATAMQPRERVSCECFGPGTVARFNGTVVAQAGRDLAIDVVGSISYAPSTETPRIYANGLSGALTTTGSHAPMRVLDVSPLSLGVFVDQAFETGSELGLTIDTDTGPIAAAVRVANCREDDGAPGHFRIGLNIADMARLDRARWGRLVTERAEA